ncbi:MAG: BACON domain-containing protein [Calditrichia bacterium]
MRYLIVALLLGTVVILSCEFLAGPEEDKAGEASISGQVKDTNGQNVRDVIISTAPETRSVLTDGEGRYVLTELPYNPYTISAQKDGYQTEQKNVTIDADTDYPISFVLRTSDPVLRTNPLLLDFGATTTVLPLEIINDGEGILNWQITEDVPWIINISPRHSGQSRADSSAVVTVQVDRSNLPEGRETNSLTISSNAGARVVSVAITKGAFIEASSENLDFDTSLEQLFFTLKNGGEGTINYSISTTASWLTVNPGSGSLENEEDIIEVNVNRVGLPFNTYYGRIVVNSGSGTINIDVVMVVPNPNEPQLTLSSNSLDFGNSFVDIDLQISNSGVGTLNWQINESLDWLTVSLANGTSMPGQPSTVKFTVSRANRNAGTYDNQVNIITNDPNTSNFSLNVRMVIEDTPVLALSEEVLDFGRSSTSRSFEVSNTGTGSLNWSVAGNRPWLSFNPITGDNQGTVNVQVDRVLAGPGSHSGQIDVTSNAGTKPVLIFLENRSNNVAPTAEFVSTPLIGEVSTVFSFDASPSTDDFDPLDSLEFRWKWDAASEFTEWSSDRTAMHQYSNTGTKFITLEVRDLEEAVGSVSKSVSVRQNQPPSAAFIVSPLTGTVSTLFEFDAGQSSDDITPVGDLEVRWQWDSGSSFTSWTTQKLASYQYVVIGQKQIVLEVRDGAGLVSSTARTIQVGSDPVQEVEPNDTRGQANSIDENSIIYCEIGVGSDNKDWFELVAPENGKLWFEIENQETSGSNNARINQSSLLVINGFDQTTLATAGIYHSGQYYIAPNETATSAKAVVSKDRTYFFEIPQFAGHSAQYILRVFFEQIAQNDIGEPNNQRAMSTNVNSNDFYQAHVGFAVGVTGNVDSEDWYEFSFTENGFAQFFIENLHTESATNGRIDISTLYGATVFDLIPLTSASIYHSGSGGGYYIGTQETATSEKAGIDRGRSYFLHIPQYAQHSAPYEFSLSFIPISTSDIGEPNDDIAAKTSLPVNNNYDALIGYSQSTGLYDEIDWYSPDFSQHGLVKFTVKNLFPTGIDDGRVAPCNLFVKDGFSLNSLDLLRIYHSGSNGGYFIGSGESVEGSRVAVATSEEYLFSVEQFQRNQAPYNVELEFIPIPIADVLEPNDSLQIAAQIPFNTTITGISIGYNADNADWYSVTPSQNGSFQFSISNKHIAGVLGGRIATCTLYNDNGSALAMARIYHSGTGGGYYIGPDESASSTIEPLIANQIYYIEVPRWDKHVAPYTLQTSFSP